MSKKPATSKSKPKLDPGLLKAHYAYEAAINSNNTDKVMAMYDKDAEVLQPYGPIVSGHANIRKWVAGYFKQYKTHWKKVPLKNFVLGDYGFDEGTTRRSIRRATAPHPLELQGDPGLQEAGEWRVADFPRYLEHQQSAGGQLSRAGDLASAF